jgi:hypothetical protein
MLLTLHKPLRVALVSAALLATPFAITVTHAQNAASVQLNALARDVERAESIRAVNNLQNSYAQYAQFGLWADLGSLFTEDGEVIWDKETIKGRTAITKYNQDKFGGGKPGLPSGAVNTLLLERPLVNLSIDGSSAKARWHGHHMLGGGDNARWEGGIYENEYVKDNGTWKISRLHFYPQYAGPYAEGWKNATETLPIIPFHFTSDEVGVPIPAPAGAAPQTRATLASLEQRIEALNAEDKVRNLHNAYGYYVDRKMWDDIVDLFTADGVLEVGGVGIYEGAAGIRRALDRDGSAGIKNGELNDHPLFQTLIEIAPDGKEARVRGMALGMLGNVTRSTGEWAVNVYQNRFVLGGDGKWRIREMRVFPLFKSDYYQGWGKSRIVDAAPAKEFAPDRASSAVNSGSNLVPEFLPNPVTGKPVAIPAGLKVVAKDRLLPALAAKSATASGDTAARLTEARRKLALSTAYDGAMNATSAYGEYLDDSQWNDLGNIFALQGAKEVPFQGFFITPERIAHRESPDAPGGRRGISFHWLMQPVIHVAPDGRSAAMRTRLWQPRTGATGAQGTMNGAMYPNNQAILENGMWKLWSVGIDEHYFTSPTSQLGWARMTPPRAATPGAPVARTPIVGVASTPPSSFPPDVKNTELGIREQGFRGGTGQTITWPGILPMWFHYKNPVSGRQPENYWPDCETCTVRPDTSMSKHGYTVPVP